MSEKRVIKVVKRDERANRNKTNSKVARDAARKAASEMVGTVTTWINEFQQRQRTKTSKAIGDLIRDRQQPIEACCQGLANPSSAAFGRRSNWRRQLSRLSGDSDLSIALCFIFG